MAEWEWLAQVDPVKAERERFNIRNVGVLRNREGVHLGDLRDKQTHANVAIIRALTREREWESREMQRAEARGHLAGDVRKLELQLAQERREHRRAIAWHQKIMGHRFGGPSNLEAS